MTPLQTALQIATALIRQAIGDTGQLTIEVLRAQAARAVELVPGADLPLLVTELETRFSVWIGRESTLSDDEDHIAWLTAARKTGWRYWPRFRQWVESDLPISAVDSLDSITDEILGLLEDPGREGEWDRRGLIVGHVQSGKTNNYTALVCKAADAGYKLIIVLAGMHKNLRSQTQMRMDEGFLGYETAPRQGGGTGQLRVIGVGEIDPDPLIRPNYVTNRTDTGDFSRTVANNLGISPDQRPWLFVVKKNGSVLRNLLAWVQEVVANSHEAGTDRPIVTNLPLLMIDDEADHASVDTGNQVFDENGQPDPDYDPKTINSLMRKLLRSFSKSAYVGYTATPFANIFIHDRGRTAEEGEDLFPRSFIINLPAPSNYAGPVRLFGMAGESEEVSPGLPLIREISDHASSDREDETRGWMPPKHKNGHRPRLNGTDDIPDSLKEAIHAFLLSCVAKRLRGQGNQHASMLIHVTRYTSVQNEVVRQVEAYLTNIRQRLTRSIGYETLLDAFRALWERDFVPTSELVGQLDPSSRQTMPQWDEVERLLVEMVQDVRIREINGTAGDVLDYENHRQTGLKVIAIGGDKLARGLTLYGLTVSYFLRATRMYDTLMQMGRWFGYRPGYLDLCRLYTTGELREWFQHIAEASEELRSEFDHMAATGGTPKDYGLRVMSHPVLMVTSRVKMRNSTRLDLSFSGQLLETTVLPRNADVQQANLAATTRFIQSLGDPHEVSPTRERPGGIRHTWEGARVWSGVDSEAVIEYLNGYRTHPGALKVRTGAIVEFIELMRASGELTTWEIMLLAGEMGARSIAGHELKLVKRAPDYKRVSMDDQQRSGRYVIRRLLSPRDEAIDLGPEQWQAALRLTREAWVSDPARVANQNEPEQPNGPAIRQIRGLGDPESALSGHPERGVMMLYPLDPKEADIELDDPVIALGISFPASHSSIKVTYEANNIYWDQEFGGGQ